jgi:hypothetical protein|nr:hypothetical protein [uncultured Emticicia sp.]
MSNIPFITQIIKVEPFKITSLWNTGEVRVNDFEDEFNEPNKHEAFYQLANYDIFKYVSIGDVDTLQWVNLPITITFAQEKMTLPFDLDPIVLYEKSQPISKYHLVQTNELV